MCRYAYGRRRRRDAESLFVVVVAMIRKAIDVLANARRDLEDIARGNTPGSGLARSAQTDIKPMENHLNVPL